MIINEDPADYGSKGENWSVEFVKYMKAIVTHPAYAKMPDAIDEEGKIQWEAPSNRSGGKYQYTHQKRRDWWQAKALEIGIDTKLDKWISRTAKTIHPTGEKPCKRCGLTLRIAYVYPNLILTLKLKRHFGKEFEVSPLETIDEIIQRAIDTYGNKVINEFSQLLSTTTIKVPQFGIKGEELMAWIEDEYIPREPSLLSPGAMSNAPDRFDGFHSFNRCCRGIADKGRSSTNLKSYSTDRRVFEYWSEGDWIAADRLMGLIRTLFSKEKTADGGDIPTADHIGPLSLGFCHRPHFRLLSRVANSAKNNRMTLQDVTDLIEDENKGYQVISWHAKDLWDLRKHDVKTDENALRFSKMLRDNQRNAMMLTSYLLENEAFAFLVYLLELDHADFKIEFKNLRIEKFRTVFDEIVKENRITKYAIEQKARRLRIGFESLRSYSEKENRHLFLIDEISLKAVGKKVAKFLSEEAKEFNELNSQIESILLSKTGVISEEDLRNFVSKFPSGKFDVFEKAKYLLQMEMSNVAKSISELWEDDRYIRAPFDLD